MIRNFALSLLFFFSCAYTVINAQDLDSIESKISAMPETAITLRIKARQYILQSLNNNDPYSIDEVLKLYSEKYHDTIMILYPSELILYKYWNKDFGQMTKAIKGYGHSGYHSIYYNIGDGRYFYGMYKSEIMDFFCDNQYQLYSNLDREYMDAIDKDFLKLYLTYSLRVVNCQSKEIATFDELAEARTYLEKYPASPYRNYLQEQLSPTYEPSKFGFGVLVISGWGDHLGDYSNTFSYGGLFGFGADISYGRIKTYYSFSVGLGKTKIGFDYEDIYWEEKQKIATSIGEVSVGIAVVDKPKLRCVPFYGISWETIEQRNPGTEEDEPSIYLGRNHLVGLNVDWVFNPVTNFDDNERYAGIPWYNDGYVRLRLGYMFPHADKEIIIDDQQLNGSSLYVQIGLGFNFYARKKAKL